MSTYSGETELPPPSSPVPIVERSASYHGSYHGSSPRAGSHQSTRYGSDYGSSGRQRISKMPYAPPVIHQQPVTATNNHNHNYLAFDGREGDGETVPLLLSSSPILAEIAMHSNQNREDAWITQPVEAGFLRLVQNFDFKWYGSTMGTGIVSILLFTFSKVYAATAVGPLLFQLSVIFYAFNIALFTCVSAMTILRYLYYPRLFLAMVSDPGQAMYLGTLPMGFATLISMTVNIMVPRFGSLWADVALACWWADVAVSMATALGVPWLLQTRHHGITNLEKMTAGWLLPIVAPIVAAATGSLVASVLEPDRAIVVVLTSYAILGTGLPAALCVIAIYFLRVATKKLPPTEHMVSTFLPLGPLGQGGFAAQKLGEQALRIFPVTGTLAAAGVNSNAGEILYTVGFMAAIMLWGFGLMWLCFAVLSVTRQKVPFSQGWWAFTFPLGVFAMSTITMGINLPSTAFQTLGTLFGMVVMMMWCVVVRNMITIVVSGRKDIIFTAPEVTGVHNQLPIQVPWLERFEDV